MLFSFLALALLMAMTISGVYVLVIASRELRSILVVVETGLADGAPVSIQFRYLLVWTWYFPLVMGFIFMGVVVALGQIQIGMNVDDLKIRNLAYLGATGAGLSVIVWLFSLVNIVIYQIALLRREKGN